MIKIRVSLASDATTRVSMVKTEPLARWRGVVH